MPRAHDRAVSRENPTHKPPRSQWAAIVLVLTLHPTSGNQTGSRDFANKLTTFHAMEGTDLGTRGHRPASSFALRLFLWLLLALFIQGHSDLYKESDSGPQAHGSDFAASSTPHF